MKLFWLAVLIASIILLFAGYVGIGLGVLVVWLVFYRIPAMEQTQHQHETTQTELLCLLVSDMSAEERHQRAWQYIDAINAEREKARKDIFWKMSNFGLTESDPRFVK